MSGEKNQGVVIVGGVHRSRLLGRRGLGTRALGDLVETYVPHGVEVCVAQSDIELARHIGVARRNMLLLGVVIDDEFRASNGSMGFGVAMDFLTEDMEGEGPIAVVSSVGLNESEYRDRGEIRHLDREGRLWSFLRDLVIDDMIGDFEIPIDASEIRFEMPSVNGLPAPIDEGVMREKHCLDENMRVFGFMFDSAFVGAIPGKPAGLTMVYRPNEIESTVPSARIREQINRGFADLLRLYPTLEIKVER
jgi:hypothetical protein